MVSSKNNGFGYGIYVTIPRIKQPIELFILFRALGILTDKKICEYIVLNTEQEKQAKILKYLQASIIDGNKYTTEEEALKYISSYAAYNPINMEKEQGYKKKQEFTIDILDNDLFPNCKTKKQKI